MAITSMPDVTEMAIGSNVKGNLSLSKVQSLNDIRLCMLLFYALTWAVYMQLSSIVP